MDWWRRPARKRIRATTRLIAPATMEMPTPSSTRWIGCGASSRPTEVYRMLAAASMMSAPSKPLEKYSALLCP